LGDPVILPTTEDMVDFPVLPVIIFPNPLLFEGVPADFLVDLEEDLEEGDVEENEILAVVDKGHATEIIHSFNLRTFVKNVLMRFKLTARSGVTVE
jgi:hypothetical protein